MVLAAPLIGLSKLANAVAARNTAEIEQRVDFSRLARSLAPQIVWAYLEKTGRGKMIGRSASAVIAGSSASLADAILGDLLNPEAVLKLLDTGQPGGQIQLKASAALIPNGDFGSLWLAFQDAEYGLGHFYLTLPASAPLAEQYRVHTQLLQWNWRLVGLDLPQKVRDQLADELIADRQVGALLPLDHTPQRQKERAQGSAAAFL